MKKRIAWMLVLALLLSLAACQRMPGSEIDMKSSTVPIDAAETTEATAEDTTEDTTQRQTTTDQKESTEAQTEADTKKPTDDTTDNTANNATGNTQNENTGGKTDPAHQHNFQTTTVAATCNEQGYTKHTCSCGYSYTDGYTAKLGHHFVDEVVAPTSSEQGYTKHTCDRCWYSYKDTYTDPVKVVYDIEAAMASANAYALSVGFGSINYGLNLSNAGFLMPTIIQGTYIDSEEWLIQDLQANIQCTIQNLMSYPNMELSDLQGVSCRAYIIYDSLTDTYTSYFLWG